MTHVEASTAWSEIIGPDEAARFARQADLIADVQNRTTRRYGRGRTLHRRPVLGLSGSLEVPDGLPEPAAHGLFARPGTHDVLVRMSNGGIHLASDATPDIRGLAITVRGIDGPGSLGGQTDHQDFLLINHPAFNLRTSTEFVDLVHASARGQAAVLGYAVRRGVVGGPRLLAGLRSTLGRPFTGFATETFWSAVPMANGPYAMRVRLVPVDPGPPSSERAWAEDVRSRLASGPLRYDLQLQFFTDEAVTPIEDPTVDWPTPYTTVAHLVLPPQDPTSEAGTALQAEIEQMAFDPWGGLADHRPLGEIMRARKVAYRTSQVGRGLS